MSNDNLKIWDEVKHVEKKYLKDASVDGHKQSSIASLYPIHLMTKAMGPVGHLWRYEVVSEGFENTRPIKMGNEYLMDNGSLVWERVHTLFLRVYTRPTVESEWSPAAEQYGHTKYRYMTSSGKLMVDTEYAKKSCSDALKKCLSVFGVCADVFMGDFDDISYREEVQDLLALEKADTTAEKEAEQFDEMKAELDDALKSMDMVPNYRAARLIYAKKARYFEPRLSSKKFSSAAKKCLKQINDKLNEIAEKYKEGDAA